MLKIHTYCQSEIIAYFDILQIFSCRVGWLYSSFDFPPPVLHNINYLACEMDWVFVIHVLIVISFWGFHIHHWCCILYFLQLFTHPIPHTICISVIFIFIPHILCLPWLYSHPHYCIFLDCIQIYPIYYVFLDCVHIHP